MCLLYNRLRRNTPDVQQLFLFEVDINLVPPVEAGQCIGDGVGSGVADEAGWDGDRLS
jgi:hypothetical protein